MQIKLTAGITPEVLYGDMRLFDSGGDLIGTIALNQPVILTKELFEKLQPGETFRIVTTHLQTVQNPFKSYLKFICKKGNSGADWAIYCHYPSKSDLWIVTQGDKVRNEENIRSICPCDDHVFGLYRY